MNWSQLSDKERQTLIQEMTTAGFTSLDDMEEYYDSLQEDEEGAYEEEAPQPQHSSAPSGAVSTGKQYYIKPDGGIGIKQDNSYAFGGFDKKKLIDRVAKSPANWVQRLQDKYRRTITNEDGSISTHRLGYVEDGNTAIVFPEIQEGPGGLLYYPLDPVKTAIQNRDTVEMSIPEAEWFTENYKDYFPGFANGGKIHIKPEIFNGKVYYRDGGILEGNFDVDDISDEELYELDRLGYDVDIL